MVADLGGWIAVSGRLSDIQLPFRTWPASLHWQFATSWQFATILIRKAPYADLISLEQEFLVSAVLYCDRSRSTSPDRERSTLEESASCELCFAFTPGFSSR